MKSMHGIQGEEESLVLCEGEGGGDDEDELLRDRRRRSIDQNQTLGGGVGQVNRQTLQSEIPMRGGGFQRRIVTEDYTRDVQHHGLASQTDKFDDQSG